MEEFLRATMKAAIPGVAIDWGMNAQSAALPRIALYRISGGVDYSFSGGVPARRARVQIDCYAATVGAAKTLSRQAREAVSGLRTGIILGSFIIDERDFNPDPDGAGSVARVSLDIDLHYQEN